MSEFFGKDPDRQKGKPTEANPWQQDPFAAYDDPAMSPAGTGAPLIKADDAEAEAVKPAKSAGAPDYSAWRRPAGAIAPAMPERPAMPARPVDGAPARPAMPQRPTEGAPARPAMPQHPTEGAPARSAMPQRPTEGAPARPAMPQRPAEGAPARPAMPARPMEGAPAREGENPYMPPAGRPRAAEPATAAFQPDNPYAPSARPNFSAPPDFGASRARAAADAGFGIVAADATPAPRGGFAAPAPQRDNSFAALGADAPTRIARPVGGQQVSKHKTIERGVGGPFARETSPIAPEGFQSSAPRMEEDAQAESGAPRRRRAGRMARYENMEPEAAPAMDMPPSRRGPAAPPAMPPEGRERPAPSFDPFEAGDSEAAPPEAFDNEPAMDADRTPRRPAMPGERYTGARTALPQRGAPMRREQAGELPEDADDAPEGAPRAPQGQRPVRLDENGRPIPQQRPQGMPGQMPPQGQRPVRLDENGRPIPQQRPQGMPGQMPPQGQRPVRLDENGRPIPQQRPQGVPGQMPPQGQRPVRLDENGRPIPQQRPQPRPAGDEFGRASESTGPRRRMRMEDEPEEAGRFDPRRGYPEPQPRASVDRPAYAFEDEPEEEPRRRGGALIPLVTVLLVLGGILAGIVLPDWDNMGGGLGTAMGKIKGAVVGMIDSVKGLVIPEEAGIKSISVNPTAATAPVELVFNVQASTSVTDIRILDQSGAELLSKTLTDSDMLGGEVTKNSKYNIWTLRYTMSDAYSGVFTAQAMKKDGTWDEGMTLQAPVSIAPPVVVEPPVQGFDTDTPSGQTPATVGFTVVTSLDVSAVQIVDDYGTVVAEAYLSDAGDQVTEDGQTRTWSLSAQVADPYTGGYYAGYETGSDLTFTQSDYSIDVALTAEGDAPAAAADGETDAALTANGGDAAADVPADTEAPAETEAPVATEAPTQAPAEATPVPEATPAPTPLPLLTAAADDSAAPSAIKLDAKAYEDLKLKDGYAREKKIVMLEPYQYAIWEQSGVLTFRGDPFRQNAAYGTVDIRSKTLSEIWRVPMEGSIKAKSATLTGLAWPGQPLIVKWPTQLRAILGLNDAAKAKQALKEVMVGGQNGKLYFLDLVTGEATREALNFDWPSNGALSLQTNATPMLAVGQHIGVLAKKTVDNAMHLYNLMNNKELASLKGKDKLMRSNYSGFNGAPLFDKNTGAMVFGGENGVLYTMEPHDEFDHVLATLKVTPAWQRYTWLADKQKAKSTNIDGSVAMYGSYVYFGDQSGIVQCVDVNTLTPVWAVNTGDNVDATIALDMESADSVALYTANTIVGQGRTGVCTIRRLDALTGKQAWAFTVPDLVYTTEAEVGVYASPVVGTGKASGIVYFTATNGTKGATLYALGKQDGSVKWSLPLTSPTISSPVAVYNANGDAWIVQAEGSGKLYLIDALTGQVATTMQLEGGVEGSPAVYRDVLVIATTGANSAIYGIKLE